MLAVLLQLLAIGLSNGAVIALSAIGVTVVYSVVRSLNFAYGDLFALTTVVVTAVINALGLVPASSPALLAGGLIVALGAAMAFGALLNVGIERVAFRPFRNSSRLGPLIASAGLSFILFQGALIWKIVATNNQHEHYSDVDHVLSLPRTRIPALVPRVNLLHGLGLPTSFSYQLKDLLVLLAAGGLALLVSLFLRRTRTGRALSACAQDAEMAQLCGVNRDGAIRLAFGIGGVLAGAAAMVFALYYERPFAQHGIQSGLTAFAAAVLGGIGRPGGAFVSGLALGVLAALSDYFLSPQWTPVLVLVLLVVLLVLRPTGLAAEGDDGAAVPIRRPISGPRGRWAFGVLVALALVYPLLDRSLGIYALSVATGILIFGLLSIGLNLLVGMAGLLDLGYAAIFAIGGYTAALLTSGRFGALDLPLIIVVCVLTTALFGALNGALTLRLRGEYLAIVTLAFGQIIPRVFVNLDEWTSGSRGIAALPPPRLFGTVVQGQAARYYLALVVLALVAGAVWRLSRSRLGRAWAALSMDEAAAMSCGVPLRARISAFVVSASIAGVAGALFATIFSYVNTDQSDVSVSAMLLAMVIIGGAGSVRGAIVGALVIAGANQFAISRIGAWVDRNKAALTGWPGQLASAVDLRSLSYLFFGLVLYGTVLLRERDKGRLAADSR